MSFIVTLPVMSAYAQDQAGDLPSLPPSSEAPPKDAPSDFVKKVWATSTTWEAGFTTPITGKDGHYTLFGATAPAVAAHSLGLFGTKYSTQEVIQYFRFLSTGLVGGRNHSAALKDGLSNGLCSAIEDFRTEQAVSLFKAVYIDYLSLDKIKDPDLAKMLIHVSWNGDHGALWVIDKMTHELQGKIFTAPMPQLDKKSPYHRPQPSEPKDAHRAFAQDLVARFNEAIEKHPQAKDPDFAKHMKVKLYETVRIYYTNLRDQNGPRNSKFILGWLRRFHDIHNVDLSKVEPLVRASCDRPIERARPFEKPIYVFPEEDTIQVVPACHFAESTIHVRMQGQLVLKEVKKPAEILPWTSDELCTKSGGQFDAKPRLFLNGLPVITQAPSLVPSCPSGQPKVVKGKKAAAPSKC